MDPLNVCLTGLPRSGTTLVCMLLNRLPNAIALHEPLGAKKFARYRKNGLLFDYILQFFEQTRRSIADSGTVITKPARLGSGGRKEVTIQRPWQDPFTLCVKQPAAFTAILEGLAARFSCFAVVRNPLAVLASWNRVNMPVREGHSPAAERLDSCLAAELARISDKFDRQVCLLSWYYLQYSRFLPMERVLKYEDIVGSRGSCLKAVSPGAKRLDVALKDRNRNPLYDRDLMERLTKRLLRHEGAFWRFYSRQSVELLVAAPSVPMVA